MELRALLEDVERLEGGAWSDRLLQASHHRPGMDAAAAARHTALLRLALEEWLRHDHVLAARVRNRPRPRIHAALRLGLLLLEDGHPAHAVVDGLLKELSGLPDAERGLVNAVLRTLLRKDLPLSPLPDPALGRDLWLTDLGMALSLPPWFLRLVEELEGPEALPPIRSPHSETAVSLCVLYLVGHFVRAICAKPGGHTPQPRASNPPSPAADSWPDTPAHRAHRTTWPLS